MTKGQQILYMTMRLDRILSNTVDENRPYWLKCLEHHRKELGSMQYAPTPQEILHKNDLQHKQSPIEEF